MSGADFYSWGSSAASSGRMSSATRSSRGFTFHSDPAWLLEKLRAANQGGDVHLAGGPRTIEAFRALEALDKLELVVLPLLFGAGMRLTPSLSPDIALTFERALPGGSVEIV
jgi:dihydrofolate reductase